MNILTLTELVETAIAAFPTIGDRADSAADLIDHHRITPGATVEGMDHWIVDGYVASVKAGTCTCEDHHAPAGLCPHRLAAMFVIKQQKAMTIHLTELLVNAPGPSVVLRVGVLFRDNDRLYTLDGHHYPGQPWELYRFDQRQRFTEDQFEAACRIARWEITDRPSTQPAYTFNYFLGKIDPTLPPNPTPWRLGDYSAQTTDRINERRRFEQMAA